MKRAKVVKNNMKKAKANQLTLKEFDIHSHSNPLNCENLIPLVIWKQQKVGPIRLEKTCIIILLQNFPTYINIYQHMYGPFSIEIHRTIHKLINEGLIEVMEINNKTLYVLTEKGLKYLEEKLPILKNHPLYDDIIKEIENLHNKTTAELVEMAYEKAMKLKPIVRYIGSHKITYVFDWSDYGDGLIKPYHISMLFAFAYFEEYFMKLRIRLPETAIVSIDDIKDTIHTHELLNKIGKGDKFILLPEILQKREPAILKEDKEEGKNYIANLWMIIEAINIFHTIPKIAPNIDEIGTLCLKNVFFGKYANFKNVSKRELRALKEKTLRNDLRKLVKWGLVEPIECERSGKKEVRFKLVARRYIDDYLGKEFKVADKKLLLDFYQNKIKPILKL